MEPKEETAGINIVDSYSLPELNEFALNKLRALNFVLKNRDSFWVDITLPCEMDKVTKKADEIVQWMYKTKRSL